MYKSLSEQIYDQLMNMIITKAYKPGDKLPTEMALCETFGVSRNTLRAAMNKLNTLGFTETKQGGGTYIRKVGSDVYLNFFVPALLTHNIDILEILHFRKGIEVEAAALAAKNATEEDLALLNSTLEKYKGDADNLDILATDNMDFHEAIARASHNKMFITMIGIIKSMTLPEMKNFLNAQGDDIDSEFYHSMVLQSIKLKKPEEAAFFMERHMVLLIERVGEFISPIT